MAEFTGIGYGIGEALNRVAENLTERKRLKFEERERQADKYEEQARDISRNIAELGGHEAPEAKDLVAQLQDVVSKHNALYPPHETPALIQRIKKFVGKKPSEPRPDPRSSMTAEGELARTTPRKNTILQELQDLQGALVAGGQSKDEAQRNAVKAMQRKYGVTVPGKAPRLERDPVTHDIIGVVDEETGTTYDASSIETAPQNVQQAWNAALKGQQDRPAEASSVKTEFELFMKQYPTATVQQWADFKAKEARGTKTRKEQITEQIADAFEKGDTASVKRFQSELMAIDPAGAERLRDAAENLELREVAQLARQESAKEKRVAPLRALVDTAENARKLKQMGDAGNASADVDLTLEFFKVIRGAEGSGIRFSRNEQDFITTARSLAETLEVKGNQVFSNGQPLAGAQRQRMVNVIDIHAVAAQRRMDEIEAEEPITPATLKERAKPRGAATPPKKPGTASEKQSVFDAINNPRGPE